jgi:hypothetical protein
MTTPRIALLGRAVLLGGCAVLASSQALALDVTVNPGGNIQAALDTVGAAGGGTVFVNYATYNISASLLVPNNTRIKGVTTRPIIKMAAAANKSVFRPKVAAFNAVTYDFIAVNGGLTDAQMDSGGSAFNSTMGIHHGNTGTYGSNLYVYNSTVTNCSQGVVMGEVNNAEAKWLTITNCGGMPVGSTPGLHNAYISNVNPFLAHQVNSSNCRTGMGFKMTDFNNNRTETSQRVENCVFNNNKDRGIAAYYLSPLVITGTTCNNNQKSGINLITCSNITLTNNTATGNPLVVDVSYDIWLNGCSNITQSGNTYGSKRGF